MQIKNNLVGDRVGFLVARGQFSSNVDLVEGTIKSFKDGIYRISYKTETDRTNSVSRTEDKMFFSICKENTKKKHPTHCRCKNCKNIIN